VDNYFCSVIFITHVLYTTVGCALRASSLAAPPPPAPPRSVARAARLALSPALRAGSLLSPALRAGSPPIACAARWLSANGSPTASARHQRCDAVASLSAHRSRGERFVVSGAVLLHSSSRCAVARRSRVG
jgi:hypothetical protein